MQFQQRNHEAVRLVQDALLLREENKRRYGFKTSQGIYAIGKVVLIVAKSRKNHIPIIPSLGQSRAQRLPGANGHSDGLRTFSPWRMAHGLAGHELVSHAEQVPQNVGIDARQAN